MLVWVACFAALGGFLFGFDLGLIGGALLDISDHFGTSDGVNEVIVGAAKLGALGGTFLGGGLMLYYGRRPAIAVDSLFFIAGPLLMAAATNVIMLVVGRFVVGVGIGVSAVVVPTYLGEVAPAKYRGRVVELYEVLLCVGMLAAALSDAAFQHVPGTWRWMVGVPAIPAVLMSTALWLLPESPRWLVIHGKLDEALAVIHRIYTSKQLPLGLQNSNAEVNQELLELWSSVEKDKAAEEERRARRLAAREAAREAQETKVAPLAGAASGLGGALRFKGGWSRLQEDQGADFDETIHLEAEAVALGAVAVPGGLRAGLPPLPPAGSGSGASAASRHSSGSEAGPVVGGPVLSGDAKVHSSAGNLHLRHGGAAGAAGLDPAAALQQQEEGGAAGLPPQPPPGATPPGQGSPVSPHRGPSPAGAGAQGGGSGSSSPGLGSGVSSEHVLPVPRGLPRIRTRSTEFEVVQEDLKPLADFSDVRPLVPGREDTPPTAPAATPPRQPGGAHQPPPLPQQQQGLLGRQGSVGGESGYSYDGGEASDPAAAAAGGAGGRRGCGALWTRLLGGRARRASTVPWTANQTVGTTSRGFWSTLWDMVLDITIVARGPEAGALRMALWLAFFNQAFASTAIINYAPEVLRRAGVQSHAAASFFTSAVGGSKMVGVVLSFFLVDSLGRRPLLLWGSLGCAAALGLLALADWAAAVLWLVLGMCAFIFAFSISWAGVFWVLLAELFSMSTKSPAVSAATAMLFLTGAVSDLVFLSLHSWLGPFSFAVFAALAAAAGIYVARVVPETKGRSMEEVQQLLGGGSLTLGGDGGSGEGGAPGGARIGELPGLLPPGAVRSAPAVELGRGQGGLGWARWR